MFDVGESIAVLKILAADIKSDEGMDGDKKKMHFKLIMEVVFTLEVALSALI